MLVEIAANRTSLAAPTADGQVQVGFFIPEGGSAAIRARGSDLRGRLYRASGARTGMRPTGLKQLASRRHPPAPTVAVSGRPSLSRCRQAAEITCHRGKPDD